MLYVILIIMFLGFILLAIQVLARNPFPRLPPKRETLDDKLMQQWLESDSDEITYEAKFDDHGEPDDRRS